MTPGPLARGLAIVYALIDALVVIAPAVAVRATGARAGIEGEYDLDLFVTSVVIGVIHAVVAWRRLVDEERAAERAVDVWIASINALVVLAFCSTFLITGVLLGFTDVHALLAQRGAPVVLLWAGCAVVSVLLAELTGHWVYRWLEPEHPVRLHHADDPADGQPEPPELPDVGDDGGDGAGTVGGAAAQHRGPISPRPPPA